MVRHAPARQDEVWVSWHVVARLCAVWRGPVWILWHGEARKGMAWLRLGMGIVVKHGAVRLGRARQVGVG